MSELQNALVSKQGDRQYQYRAATVGPEHDYLAGKAVGGDAANQKKYHGGGDGGDLDDAHSCGRMREKQHLPGKCRGKGAVAQR